MQDLILFNILGFIINLILVIIFIVMAVNVSKIKRKVCRSNAKDKRSYYKYLEFTKQTDKLLDELYQDLFRLGINRKKEYYWDQQKYHYEVLLRITLLEGEIPKKLIGYIEHIEKRNGINREQFIKANF